MQDLTVILENAPGSLARLGDVLGNAGINIEGGCAITDPSGTAVHILVVDPAKTRHLLDSNGFAVKDGHDAIAFYVSSDDTPGIHRPVRSQDRGCGRQHRAHVPRRGIASRFRDRRQCQGPCRNQSVTAALRSHALPLE